MNGSGLPPAIVSALIAGLTAIVVAGVAAVFSSLNYKLAKKNSDQVSTRAAEESLLDNNLTKIRLISSLDVFAYQSTLVALDYGSEDRNGITTPLVQLPRFNVESLAKDIRTLHTNIIHQVAQLESLQISAEAEVTLIALRQQDPTDDAELFHHRQRLYFTLAVKALRLSRRIRSSIDDDSGSILLTRNKRQISTSLKLRREQIQRNSTPFYLT